MTNEAMLTPTGTRCATALCLQAGHLRALLADVREGIA